MTFGRNSKDLIDCPLIPLDNVLVALPAILATISPSEALFSNFLYKNLDISFKGLGLEKRLRRQLSDLNLNFSHLYSSEYNQEYECDLAFTIDQDLFFVECKSFVQPQSVRKHYEFIDKIFDATRQLNRVANYYIQNLEKVREKLNLLDDWTPGNIYNLVVSSAMLGRPTFVNNCHVVDESVVLRFFARESPGFALYNIRIGFGDKNYEGEVTSEKFLKVLTSPPPIVVMGKQLIPRVRKMELKRVKFQFSDLEKTTGDLVFLGPEQEKQLADSLNIPLDILRGKLNLPDHLLPTMLRSSKLDS